MILAVREMQKEDIEHIINYFVNAESSFLEAMGADKTKLPDKEQWIKKLQAEYSKTYQIKEFYYIVWLVNNNPVGHSNINNIQFGDSAVMHLHLWESDKRKNGIGVDLIKQTIPYYFKNFKLKSLICEPYAKNIAPNKVLQKIGFEYKKTYETTPGWINFHQTVNRYELTKERFHVLWQI